MWVGVGLVSTHTVWRDARSFGDGGVGVLSTPTVWPDPRSLGDGTVGGVSTMWQDARLLGGGLAVLVCELGVQADTISSVGLYQPNSSFGKPPFSVHCLQYGSVYTISPVKHQC